MTAMKGIGVGVVGTGAFLPDTIRTNDWWPDDWREARHQPADKDITETVDKAAYKRSVEVDPEVARHAGPYYADPFRGTRQRRVMDEHDRPSDMEAAACKAALADAGIAADEVDLLLGFSQVRDTPVCGNEGRVAHLVGIPTSAAVMENGAGCVSFLTQLKIASRLVQSGEHHTALVYCSSAFSRITDYTQPSSVLPGDAAVAAVIRRVEPGYGYIAQSNLVRGDWAGAIHAAPTDHPHVPWYDFHAYDGPLFVQRLDPHAAHCMGVGAARIFREVAEPLFEKTGYRPEDVDFFVLGQVGAWFPVAMCEAIGIDPARTLAPGDHFERFGHCMAASMPLNMHLARQLGKLDRDALVLMFAPGVGFNAAASLVRWSHPRATATR